MYDHIELDSSTFQGTGTEETYFKLSYEYGTTPDTAFEYVDYP